MPRIPPYADICIDVDVDSASRLSFDAGIDVDFDAGIDVHFDVDSVVLYSVL